MTKFDHEIAPAVVEACQAGADETSEALSRALDGSIALTVGEAGSWDQSAPPSELGGPGLLVALHVGDVAATLLVPESGGILPDWYTAPDPTGISKLTTLAQELGMLLLPEEFMPEDFSAQHVANLGEALERGKPAEESGSLRLELVDGEKKSPAWLVWPVQHAGELFPAKEEKAEEKPAEEKPAQPAEAASRPPTPRAPSSPKQTPSPVGRPVRHAARSAALPNYTRSLLRIKVPVTVTLGRKRQSVSEIVNFVPGMIIQFEKSCEELLDLEVGGQPIAQGECVKVGDKFGLRITSLTLPDERFQIVSGGG